MSDNQDRCPRCGGEIIGLLHPGLLVDEWIRVCGLCYLPQSLWEEWREMQAEINRLQRECIAASDRIIDLTERLVDAQAGQEVAEP